MCRSFALSCLALLQFCSAYAEDWSQFRGANGNGISSAENVPTEWDVKRNVAWKKELNGQSNGSPIISGDHIFVTSAEDDGRSRHTHCFSIADGSQKWVRTVKFEKKMPTHKTNLYGGTTPAANAEIVVVWHSSAGLYCYDFAGNELWKRNFGNFEHMWGYGTSPVLRGDRVILHSGPGQKVFVAAVDADTGSVLWKTDEPVENDGQRNDENKYMGSWSTPVIATVDGRDVAICSMSTRVNAYDLETGDTVFTCDGIRGERGDLAYTSPVIADDICVAMGGFKGPALGFRLAGRGNITDAQRLWRNDKRNPQRIGSGVYVDGFIYMVNAGPNTIECINPETGDQLWQERAPGGAFWGSAVYADGKIYATDQDGTTVVFRPNSKRYEEVAVNRLESPGNSTPAVADGTIVLRTFEHLYCVRTP